MPYTITVTKDGQEAPLYTDKIYKFEDLAPKVQSGVLIHYKFWLYQLCYAGIKAKFESELNKRLRKITGLRFSALDCDLQSKTYIYLQPKIGDHSQWLSFIGSTDTVYELSIQEIRDLQKKKISGQYRFEMVDNKVEVYVGVAYNKQLSEILNSAIIQATRELTREYHETYTTPEIIEQAFTEIGAAFWESGMMASDELVCIVQHLDRPELGLLNRDTFNLLGYTNGDFKKFKEEYPDRV